MFSKGASATNRRGLYFGSFQQVVARQALPPAEALAIVATRNKANKEMTLVLHPDAPPAPSTHPPAGRTQKTCVGVRLGSSRISLALCASHQHPASAIVLEAQRTPDLASLRAAAAHAIELIAEPASATLWVAGVDASASDAARLELGHALAPRGGPELLRIINNSTAACLAYGLNPGSAALRLILVFQMGRSTSAASLIGLEDGLFEVLDHSCAAVGGLHVDAALAQYATLAAVTGFLQPVGVPAPLARLVSEYIGQAPDAHDPSLLAFCARAKCQLSVREAVTLEHAALPPPGLALSRALLARLCATQLVDEPRQLVEQVLASQHGSSARLEAIVLSGGACNCPLLVETLRTTVPSATLYNSIRPEHVVARGLLLQCLVLAGHGTQGERVV